MQEVYYVTKWPQKKDIRNNFHPRDQFYSYKPWLTSHSDQALQPTTCSSCLFCRMNNPAFTLLHVAQWLLPLTHDSSRTSSCPLTVAMATRSTSRFAQWPHGPLQGRFPETYLVAVTNLTNTMAKWGWQITFLHNLLSPTSTNGVTLASLTCTAALSSLWSYI